VPFAATQPWGIFQNGSGKDVNRPSTMGRRRLLAGITGGLVALAAGRVEALQPPPAPIGTGHLELFAPATGERLALGYRRGAAGRPDDAALRALAHFFRDWHQDATGPIDTALLDTLSELQRRVDDRSIHLTCGFRTARTNRSVGGERNSLHLSGRAADIRVPGITTSRLYRTLLQMEPGGVGLYVHQGFCHVDTGDVRRWEG
jgi:uncharacterized protein YcbK (DUF882 family)